MSRPGKGFASFKRTRRFDTAYQELDLKVQRQVDKAVALLLGDRTHPSLNVHPVKPDKHYWEAYATRGDRIIYVPDGDCLVLVDVVSHDKIGRYGKRPPDTYSPAPPPSNRPTTPSPATPKSRHSRKDRWAHEPPSLSQNWERDRCELASTRVRATKPRNRTEIQSAISGPRPPRIPPKRRGGPVWDRSASPPRPVG